MSIEDQIRLINSHSDIFSSVGSAAHSILFALGKPRLHLLANRDSIPANFFICSVLADAPTTFINCLGSAGRASAKAERLDRRAGSVENPEQKHPVNTVPGPQSVPQLLDMDRVVNYLDQNGFLKNRSPAAMPGPSVAASLRRRYDEAWYYARLRKTLEKAGALPDELEREALELASKSWPVSLVLARYYVRVGDNSRADELATQFAALADDESDVARLAHFCGDVHEMASRIAAMCKPETATRIATILDERFRIESLDEWRRRSPAFGSRSLPTE
jgi:hypothetical protein